MPESSMGGNERETVDVLLASARDWFVSALQAVLEPEGFTFTHVASGELAVRDAPVIDPDVVILDEGLPDTTASELCRELISGPLKGSIPILVYSPNFWHESEQAEAMRAGAWDIIREPIRSRLLVAKLHRLVQIKRLIDSTEEDSLADTETGLFNLSGLMRTLPILGSLAQRSDAPLSCAVLGPTVPASGEELERQRRKTVRLCAQHTRLSDLCAWVGQSDVALVAYDSDIEATTGIVRRLTSLALSLETDPSDLVPISAGIVEMPPSEFVAGRRELPTEKAKTGEGRSTAESIASLSLFAAAQNALRKAREVGGGIRIAATV